jgi:toxin ParE1/3/4
MKPIRYHRLALHEYQIEAGFYNNQQVGLGLEFQQEILAAQQKISSNPQLYAAYKTTLCRGCPVDRFPFMLYYVEFDDRIVIYGVVHHKRRPGYWLRRLRKP